MASSGQWLLSVTDAPTPAASRRPFHVKQNQPSLAGRCPVSEVLSQRPEDRLDAWQKHQPGVLEVRGERQRSPGFAGSLR